MKAYLFPFVALGAAAALTAAPPPLPQIRSGSVVMTQDRTSRQVRISYTLDNAPAVVTVDILTNGVSIGHGNLVGITGEINKIVQPGAQTLRWRPDRSWPNQRIPAGGIEAVVTAWPTNAPPDYMVIDLTGGPNSTTPAAEKIRYYTCEAALPFPGGVTNDLCKTDYLVMRKIHAAGKTFRMGITEAEKNGETINNAAPHYVQLTNDYYIGVYEFTQRQWDHLAVKLSRPSYFTNNWQRRPVECTGGTYVRGYSDKASDTVWPINGHAVNENGPDKSKTGLYQLRRIVGGLLIDLPTEAQWEFAARSGKGGIMPDGSSLFVKTEMVKYGRFPGSPDLPTGITVNRDTPPENGGTSIVGSYPPNAWGLYDMMGNVRELCLDAWKASYDQTVTHIDPVGLTGTAAITKNHVVRGGHWGAVYSIASRASYNINWTGTGTYADSTEYSHATGFRVCLTLP
jgi:formylglycine-generating enzyme required for sulfatase activity